MAEDFPRNWRDIASAFLRLGATSYGGPAIMGIMQAELEEKRQWVSRERFATVTALLVWRLGAVRLMIAGSLFGLLRSRLFSLPGVKGARDLSSLG